MFFLADPFEVLRLRLELLLFEALAFLLEDLLFDALDLREDPWAWLFLDDSLVAVLFLGRPRPRPLFSS